MRRNSCRLFLGILLALLLLAGCAHYPLNQPLSSAALQKDYVFETFSGPADADETFVALTFSGGGTRAAALAYGVLEEMRRTRVPGAARSLLDEIDVISTVSGGSFTGA